MQPARAALLLVRDDKPTLHAGQSSPRSLGDSSHPLPLLYTPTSIHTSTRPSTSSTTSESEHDGRGRGDLAHTARRPPNRPTGTRTHPTLTPAYTPNVNTSKVTSTHQQRVERARRCVDYEGLRVRLRGARALRGHQLTRDSEFYGRYCPVLRSIG